MATPNPEIARLLEQAKKELDEARSEKARLFPPNLHPLAQSDTYPQNYTADQIAARNKLNDRIESLERRIEELQNRLYSK